MLGDKIRELRKQNKMSINRLSKETGISLGYLSDLENNKSKNPSIDKLSKIANTLHVAVRDFFDNDLEYWDATIDTDKLHESAAIYGSINLDNSTILNIPIVGTVRAGVPILATENIEGYQPTLRNSLCTDKDYFYLRVQGDSMNQEFDEGSLLLIEQISQLENGQIGVILIDGLEATVKKVIQNENMITLIPMSNNPKHIPQMYDLVKDEIRIVGRVKQVVKNYY